MIVYMVNDAILRTPKARLPMFDEAADRLFWSEPRVVRVLYSDLEGLVWVRHERRNGVRFPVNGVDLTWVDTKQSLAPRRRRAPKGGRS